jgi:CheY-like chemotaxis protein
MVTGSILIVGDGGAPWAACGEWLRRAGYGVLEAATIDAALRVMRRHTPAALLLRVDADAAALRLCRRVRSHAPFSDLPVLGIVAGKPRLRLTAAGFSELVREPFSAEQLLRLVSRWLPVQAARSGSGGRRHGQPAVAPTSEWRGLS